MNGLFQQFRFLQILFEINIYVHISNYGRMVFYTQTCKINSQIDVNQNIELILEIRL
jgi:hypothetical protein